MSKRNKDSNPSTNQTKKLENEPMESIIHVNGKTTNVNVKRRNEEENNQKTIDRNKHFKNLSIYVLRDFCTTTTEDVHLTTQTISEPSPKQH
jgi:hypothetical protein